VPASQLGQVTFVAGTVSNSLQVRAFDGVTWSAADTAAWSPFVVYPDTGSDGAGFQFSGGGAGAQLALAGAPVIGVNDEISAGSTPEISSPYSGTILFDGSTGTLKIDNSSTFSGSIAGQLAIGNVIDLADITAGTSATIAYSGNNSPGTLTVSDGTQTANIALLGQYMATSFVAASDGHGGTLVTDPPASATPELFGGPATHSE
jgi:hypothetical protein